MTRPRSRLPHALLLVLLLLAACGKKPVLPLDSFADLQKEMQDWIDHVDPGHRWLVVASDRSDLPNARAYRDKTLAVVATSEWLNLSDSDRLVLANKVHDTWDGILRHHLGASNPVVITDALNHALVTFDEQSAKPNLYPAER